MTLEDRFVDVERIEVEVAVVDVRIGQQRVVEYLAQLLVGDDLVASATDREGRRDDDCEHDCLFHGMRYLIILILGGWGGRATREPPRMAPRIARCEYYLFFNIASTVSLVIVQAVAE